MPKLSRKCHFLKRLTTSEQLQQAIFFDTETFQVEVDPKTVKHVLKFGMACYTRRTHEGAWSEPEWFRYDTKMDFWNWVCGKARPKTKLYLFCHNTGFDPMVMDLFGELNRRDWKIETCIIENPPTILRFRKERASLILLDTLNFWRQPLEKIGKFINLPKLDMPKISASLEEWDLYCKRDTDILRKAVTEWSDFLKDNDFGGFGNTLAGQSKKIYQHRFMTHPIGIHNDLRVTQMEREAYHGGRTEVFKIGAIVGRWHLVDFNSQYPSVMFAESYPTKLAFTFKERTPENIANMCQNGSVVARVVLCTSEPVYPVLKDGKLTFPIGEFKTTLNTPELIYAVAHGHIKQVIEGSYYDKAPIFKAFIDYMYPLRMKYKAAGNKLMEEFYKILMNSLYGKFGQHGFVYDKERFDLSIPNGNWIEIDQQTKEVKKYRALSGLVQCMKDEIESRDSFPAIAGHVTSFGRMLLWQTIVKAGRENVAYIDTDSLLVNDIGLSRIHDDVDADALGKLKLERSFGDCTINTLKDYKWDDVVKLKGIKKNATWIGSNTAIQESWSSIKGALRDNHLDAPWTKTVKKTLSRDYNKGVIQPSGDVTPFVLGLS